MSADIRKFIDLDSRYAIYGENGYYIDPFIIQMAIVDNLNLAMSYTEIEEFIRIAAITLTSKQIKEYLEQKLVEENPELKKRIEKPKSKRNNNIAELTDQDINNSSQEFIDNLCVARYYFEPYSLEYFNTYISILKVKCQTLFGILSDLFSIKRGKIALNQSQVILDLDFHINEVGDIYFADAIRLLDAIIYNVKDLHDKVNQGNKFETYLTFKKSKHQLLKDGVFESEIYPRKEIQIKDLNYAYSKEFIALSEKQKEQLEKEQLEDFSCFIATDFSDDEEEKQNNPVLKKTMK